MKNKIQKKLAAFTPQVNQQPSFHAAAILIPFYNHEGKDYVVLTKRSHNVRHHQGQMAFPGGLFSKKDQGLLQTALREADEEIGIKAKDITILGQLSDVPTITQFIITPFVGWIPYPYHWKVDPKEVDEVVKVPFSFFCNHRNCTMQSFKYKGSAYMAPAFHYKTLQPKSYLIWGATARILLELVALLK